VNWFSSYSITPNFLDILNYFHDLNKSHKSLRCKFFCAEFSVHKLSRPRIVFAVGTEDSVDISLKMCCDVIT